MRFLIRGYGMHEKIAPDRAQALWGRRQVPGMLVLPVTLKEWRPMVRYHMEEPQSGVPHVSKKVKTESKATPRPPKTAQSPAAGLPPARSELNSRLCGRCFARNSSGETYCKVCGEPLPD